MARKISLSFHLILLSTFILVGAISLASPSAFEKVGIIFTPFHYQLLVGYSVSIEDIPNSLRQGAMLQLLTLIPIVLMFMGYLFYYPKNKTFTRFNIILLAVFNLLYLVFAIINHGDMASFINNVCYNNHSLDFKIGLNIYYFYWYLEPILISLYLFGYFVLYEVDWIEWYSSLPEYLVCLPMILFPILLGFSLGYAASVLTIIVLIIHLIILIIMYVIIIKSEIYNKHFLDVWEYGYYE